MKCDVVPPTPRGSWGSNPTQDVHPVLPRAQAMPPVMPWHPDASQEVRLQGYWSSAALDAACQEGPGLRPVSPAPPALTWTANLPHHWVHTAHPACAQRHMGQVLTANTSDNWAV